jgi:Thermostable hemolysin
VALPRENPITGIFCASNGEDLHELACEFARDQYAGRLSCNLVSFYPNTISLYVDGRLTAVAGYREAAREQLFLEQYLDAPIEECLRRKFQPGATRSHIVEIGGFAALGCGAGLALMQQLAPTLLDLGFRQLVCTANRAIQKCLSSLGLEPVFIAQADADRISTPVSDWGNYYEGNPVVLAGDIEAGMKAMVPRCTSG